MRARLPLVAVSAVAVITAWCVSVPSSAAPPGEAASSAASSAVVTSWQLKQVNERQYGTPVLRDALGVVTLRFEGTDSVEGQAGCRRFRAGYAFEGGAVRLTTLSVNESRCPIPSGGIDVVVTNLTEERFHASISDGELIFTTVGEGRRLVFSALE